MSMDIGPGDWVVPNDAANERYYGSTLRRVEQLTRKGLCTACEKISRGLVLFGLPPEPPAIAHCPNHWKPIHRGNTNLIESLKEIAGRPLVCDPA